MIFYKFKRWDFEYVILVKKYHEQSHGIKRTGEFLKDGFTQRKEVEKPEDADMISYLLSGNKNITIQFIIA